MSSIKRKFKELRFDPDNHLGLGDIRLTMGQQEEIVGEIDELVRYLDMLIERLHGLYEIVRKDRKSMLAGEVYDISYLIHRIATWVNKYKEEEYV